MAVLVCIDFGRRVDTFSLSVYRCTDEDSFSPLATVIPCVGHGVDAHRMNNKIRGVVPSVAYIVPNIFVSSPLYSLHHMSVVLS